MENTLINPSARKQHIVTLCTAFAVLSTGAIAMNVHAPHAIAHVGPPAPYGALPSEGQVERQEMGMVAFLHFSPNTFTDKEWGYGDEDPSVFNPTDFNADQIVLALKAAGVKGAILTCKHHDGFCLWPTATTEHSIAHSSWRNGKGDVVKEISEACRRHGLKFGVYLSPWDRNNPAYGTPAYIEIYRRQLTELLTHYGPIFEVWHDGANGGDGYYGGARETRSIDRRTYYHWPETWALVRRLQPSAVIFSDAGPDLRWVGNESGYANETCWETYMPVGEDGGAAAPGYSRYQEAGTGEREAKEWMPAECDVSIRPGWFWHEKENSQVKSPGEILDLYYKSVGRGACFLLNVPPDRRGQLHDQDVASLRGFGELLHATFAHNLASSAKLEPSNIRGNQAEYGPGNLLDGRLDSYWATDDGVTTPSLTIDFRKPVTFDVIRLGEDIRLGQRIEQVAVDVEQTSGWKQIAEATSIGACRIIRLPEPVTAARARLRIVKSPVSIALSELGFYQEPK